MANPHAYSVKPARAKKSSQPSHKARSRKARSDVDAAKSQYAPTVIKVGTPEYRMMPIQKTQDGVTETIKVVAVKPVEISAARARVAADRLRGTETPPWIIRLAKTSRTTDSTPVAVDARRS